MWSSLDGWLNSTAQLPSLLPDDSHPVSPLLPPKNDDLPDVFPDDHPPVPFQPCSRFDDQFAFFLSGDQQQQQQQQPAPLNSPPRSVDSQPSSYGP